MQMRHCHYYSCIIVRTVNYLVREAGKKATPQSRNNLGTRQRVPGRPTDRSVEFIEEFLTQSVDLIVVPDHSVVKFLLGQSKKADFHECRYFSMTSR